MTSTSALWTRHPGVRPAPAGPVRNRLLVAALTLGAVVVLVGFRHAGAAMVAALGLSALAVIESAVVLISLRRADRIAAEVALHQLGAERSAAALARDLRDELGRLHQELARVAAQTAIAAQPASDQRPHDAIR